MLNNFKKIANSKEQKNLNQSTIDDINRIELSKNESSSSCDDTDVTINSDEEVDYYSDSDENFKEIKSYSKVNYFNFSNFCFRVFKS